jgi:hypothetical protein
MTARYVVFAGEAYYPGMAMRDYIGAYPTLEEAQQIAKGLLTPRTVTIDDDETGPESWQEQDAEWAQIAKWTEHGLTLVEQH